MVRGTIYLSREANLATLASLATVSARGSEIVFNYIDPRALALELIEDLARLSRRHVSVPPFLGVK